MTNARQSRVSSTHISSGTTRMFPCRAVLQIFLLGSALVASNLSFADEWKLQPLKYNNPGLVVDLGVGLWAYPIPLDYDNDGDLDLLVGCPDKPSRGVYFFENPSQDRSIQTPVFKPGKYVGPATHYMMLSYRGDEPAILKPGAEFARDPSTGQFDFTKSKKIYRTSRAHNDPLGRVRGNMWRYVDYDGDGNHDLVAGIGAWRELGWDHAFDSQGRWRNGPLRGYVYLMRNRGTDAAPDYDPVPVRLQAAGGDIDVYGWPSPNFADFDNDGDLDLLCGEFMDGFTYYKNIGTRTQPVYAAGQRLQNVDDRPLVMHLQMITPTAVDWDGDGDLDLVVGDEDGRVAFVENTGRLRSDMPIFEDPVYFQQEADTLKFGALATPFAYDWDSDGDEDIVCGNTAGSIGLFENLGVGDGGLPRWSAPKLIEVGSEAGPQPFRVMAGPSGSIQGPCEAKWGYTTLSVADWDADGDPDIIYNSILARLGFLENNQGQFIDQPFDSGLREAPPKWYWWQTESSSSLTQWRTTPMVVDFDADGSLDLVMLDQEGYLTVRRRGGSAERIFTDESGQPIQLNPGTCGRSGRTKLDVVDWDGDGRLDVLVNSENATWYRNCISHDGQIVLKRVGNLAKRNVAGHTSSPTTCDFDRDGKPDLLVGSENGRIYHIAHSDCIAYSGSETSASKPAPSKEPIFPGYVRDEFVFGSAPFKECHASTICETTRGLVTAWFGGSKEGKNDVGIWSSYHDGLKWSTPLQVANGVQYDGLRYPCWNPVLFQPPGDAPLLLFFKVGPNPREWWGEVLVSYDRGRTFNERHRLPTGIDGPVRCKPISRDGGTSILCGSSTEFDGWRVHFERVNLSSGELTSSWSRIGPINEATNFNAIQPTFLAHSDGRLQVLCRTKEGVIASSESSDDGKTWSQLEATSLPNPNSGIDAVTLADGRQLLVYNHLGSGKTGWGKRGLLNLAISSDGQSWNRVGVLEMEPGAEFSYPAMIQTEDGRVHLTYTWKRSQIKHVTLDPSAFEVGETITRDSKFESNE